MFLIHGCHHYTTVVVLIIQYFLPFPSSQVEVSMAVLTLITLKTEGLLILFSLLSSGQSLKISSLKPVQDAKCRPVAH